MKKIIITEKQLNNLKGAFLRNFGNPLTLYLNNTKALNEGIFKTYPLKKVKKYIMDMFDLPDDNVQISLSEQNNLYFMFVVLPNVNGLINNVIKAMALCGYFCSYKDIIDNGNKIYLQFEPKHQDNANEEVRSMKYIYHVSPEYNKTKILQNGFSPKAKNSLFTYPDRVYFFKQNSTENDITDLVNQMNRFNNSAGNKNKYIVFVLSIDKIPNNVNFYLDGNYENGVYTNDNIPPSSIIDMIELDLKIVDENKISPFKINGFLENRNNLVLTYY